MNEYFTYIIALDARGFTFDPTRLEHFVKNDPDIVSYWNYLRGVYCVKTRDSITELSSRITPILFDVSFFIAEINPSNVNGRLPRAAWEWFGAAPAPKNALMTRGVHGRP